MPELSELLADECWVEVEVEGGTFQVAYRPSTISLGDQARLMKHMREMQTHTDIDEEDAAREVAIMVCKVIVAWDLSDQGELLPLTPEIVATVIPGAWIDSIMQAVSADRTRTQEEKKQSNSPSAATSKRAAKRETARNGTPSSRALSTWA